MRSKYEIAKDVALSGRQELSEMLEILDTLWIQGDLTREQKDELVKLARDHADPAMSANLAAEIDELRQRIEKLEKGAASSAPAEEYPEYIEGKRYYPGDKVTFQGIHYKCIAPEGQVCVWSPAAYPDYWQAV